LATDVLCSPAVLSAGIFIAHRLVGSPIDMPQIVDIFTKVSLARWVGSMVQYARDDQESSLQVHLGHISQSLIAATLMRYAVEFTQNGCAAQLAQCCGVL